MLGVKYKVPLFIVIICCTVARTFSQDLSTNKPQDIQELPTPVALTRNNSEPQPPSTSDQDPTSTTTVPSSTMSPKEACESQSSSCEACVGAHKKCVYCKTSKKCSFYPYEFPPKKLDCDISDASWGTCLVNVKTIIIVVSSVAGALVLGLIICCCCCCRKHSRNKWAKQLEKWDRERKEMKERHEERRQERQMRTDEIRKKYGLFKEDNPYSRFDG